MNLHNPLSMPRWLPGRHRAAGLTLAAAGWSATLAAVIAGGHLGRGAAGQIIFAVTMATAAAGEILLSPAVPVIIDDQAPPGAAGRQNGLSTVAVVTGCLLGPLVGGAALGAGWGTSVLTTLAVACAVASFATHRLGRRLAPGVNRIPVTGTHPAADAAVPRRADDTGGDEPLRAAIDRVRVGVITHPAGTFHQQGAR